MPLAAELIEEVANIIQKINTILLRIITVLPECGPRSSGFNQELQEIAPESLRGPRLEKKGPSLRKCHPPLMKNVTLGGPSRGPPKGPAIAKKLQTIGFGVDFLLGRLLHVIFQ